jgi:ABC-type polysaccharide/polyol phosphate transport system ATPase subunit
MTLDTTPPNKSITEQPTKVLAVGEAGSHVRAGSTRSDRAASRMASSGPAITVENVSKRFRIYHERNDSLKASVMRGKRAEYEEFWAVDDVAFEVYPGETFGIIGQNGSGKSTLLKCMARILRPDKGSIGVRGKLVALLELGAGFHQELSGRENVYLNGSILGLSSKEIDAKFDDIVDFAGLGRFIDTPVKNYSSGMYVRLGFSVAINVNPDVLLVDEVLAVGDETFQRRCAEKFGEMQRDGKTIVVVSHGLGQLRLLCDRLAWLQQGKLAGLGPTKDVIDQYLGTVSVSRLPGHDGISKRWGSGEVTIQSITVIGPGGTPTDKVHTGDDVRLRVAYKVNEPGGVVRPVVGFGLHRLDGVLVSGANSREQGLIPEVLTGEGHFDFRIPKIGLLTGTYDLSAAIQNEICSETYDWWFEGFRFEVLPAVVYESEGVVTTFGQWSQVTA